MTPRRIDLRTDSVERRCARSTAMCSPDGGYVLDGIPRNLAQAREAYRIAKELDLIAHVALYLDATDEELTRRLLARAAIEHRADDTAEVIAERLAVYHEITHPIVDWYR